MIKKKNLYYKKRLVEFDPPTVKYRRLIGDIIIISVIVIIKDICRAKIRIKNTKCAMRHGRST